MTGRRRVGYHRAPMRPDEIAALSVAELRARFVDGARPLPAGAEAVLEADPRAGAARPTGPRGSGSATCSATRTGSGSGA